MSEGAGLDGALSSGEGAGRRYLPSSPLAQQVGNSREAKMLHPRHWQNTPEVSPCLHCCQPTHSAQQHLRLYCLAGIGRLPQLPWLCLSPTGEVPTGASPKSSSIAVGFQSWGCPSDPGRVIHDSTHPVNHVAPPLLHDRQTAALPQGFKQRLCAGDKGGS